MLDQLCSCMDYSNSQKDHPQYADKNKAVPVFFKDESAGNYMTEVIGLCSKCNISKVKDFKTTPNYVHVVCKGITRAAWQKRTLKTFRSVVENIKIITTVRTAFSNSVPHSHPSGRHFPVQT